MEMWEIDPLTASSAKSNFPNAKVVCCDSIDRIKDNSWKSSFDVVLVDNPLSTYCDDLYCENFDVIDHIYKVFDSESLCLINVVALPFNIENEKNRIWKSRRLDFFGDVNVEIERAVEAYTNKFRKSGVDVVSSRFSNREEYGGNVYLYHVLFSLKKQ
jgi:hypothetical protein